MDNIILIGMPGSGKSTLGVVLAKKLNMRFLDSDLVIQEEYGKTLEKLIEEHGDAGFIRIEDEVNYNLNPHNTIIATGGSAVYYDAAMKHLKENGVTVYIQVSLKTVKARLSNIRTRGVAMGKGQTLDDLYDIRVPLYEKYADITVESDNRCTMEDTVEKIIKELGY